LETVHDQKENTMKPHVRFWSIVGLCIVTVWLFLYTSNLGAHGTNPNHLDSRIRNPFISTGRITSAAPGHHVIWGGDLSVDVVLSSGETKNQPVYFKGAALPVGNYFRGRVIEGGANSPVLACSVGGYDAGAYRVKVEIQLKTSSGSWTPVGWVIYAHVYDITRNNGDYINSGGRLATVSGKFIPGGKCSSGPHVHMEFYNYFHYAGYIARSDGTTFSTTASLACVGGSRAEDRPC
jgi:hypothetical protein